MLVLCCRWKLYKTQIYLFYFHFSLSLPLCFAVGQVKFDPPLRKETEPHHEPVSCSPWYMNGWQCVIQGMLVWLSLHQIQHGWPSPNRSRHPDLCCCLSVLNQTSNPSKKILRVVHKFRHFMQWWVCMSSILLRSFSAGRQGIRLLPRCVHMCNSVYSY